MKTATTLLIAFGLVASTTLAQTQTQPQPQPQQGTGAQAKPGMQSQPGSDASGAQPGSQPGGQPPSTYSSGASGAQPDSQSGMQPPPSSSGSSSMQSGPQSGMPPHSSSGTSGVQPDSQSGMPPRSSSGGSGMQSSSRSESGTEAAPVVQLQPKTVNGVTYLCGGVGKEEASYMKQEAKKHDLMLTFAAKDGEFIADVNVAIKDAKGNPVLETACDGPMMLVDLPKGGKYRIHAVANGYALDKTVTVAKAPGKKATHVASVSLLWPTQVAEAEGTGETATGSSGTGGAGSSGGDKKW